MAALALALRFVPYSDNHGHFNAALDRGDGALVLLALASSVYLVYVLEILKLRRGRHQSGDRGVRGDRARSRPPTQVVASLTNWLQKADSRALSAIVASPPARPSRAYFMSPPKYVDLLVLAAALAVFLLGGCPCSATPSAAAAWLAQRGIQTLASRRAQAELAAGNRQKAMGIIAATTLGRVWLMATAVLLVGLAEREAGLAAAILVLVLFTVSFAAQGFAHLFGEPEGQGAA